MQIRQASRAKAAATITGVVAMTALGLAGQAFAGAESETSSVARQAHAAALTPGTPCSTTARACVDLESQRAWLIRGGKVVRGPVGIASGGADQETPTGHSFRVYRKDKDHVSGEFTGPDGQPAKMPYSVFFADGGVAFHGGDRSRSSAGCVKLGLSDAEAWFNDLQNGDQVQVVNAAQETKARQAPAR